MKDISKSMSTTFIAGQIPILFMFKFTSFKFMGMLSLTSLQWVLGSPTSSLWCPCDALTIPPPSQIHPLVVSPLISSMGRHAPPSSHYCIHSSHALFPTPRSAFSLSKIITWVLKATQRLQFVKWEGSLPPSHENGPVLERVSAFQIIGHS